MRAEKNACAKNPMVNMSMLLSIELLFNEIVFGDVIVYVSVFHPSVCKTIYERSHKSVPQMIFRHSCFAWIMSYGNLFYGALLKHYEGR